MGISARSKAIFRVVAINALVLVAGLLVIELVFGSWLRAPQLWSLSIYRNVKWSFDVNDKYPREGPVRYVRDYYGLRGAYGTPAQVNVMTMGGSTTDERFVDEGHTWSDVLGHCLRENGYAAVVANAGITGQSSRGMRNDFDIWLNHVDGLSPELVVGYLGINELYTASEAQAKMDDVRTFTEAVTPHDPWKSFRKWLRMSSALYGLYETVKGNIRAWRAGLAAAPDFTFFAPPAEKSAITMAERSDARYRAAAKATVEVGSDEYRARVADAERQYAEQLKAYDRRLGELTRAIRHFGAVPVYATNPWGEFRRRGNVISGKLDLFFEQHAYHEVLRRHCKAEGLTCVDVGWDMEIEPGDFFDGAHTTEKGSAKVGTMICRGLLEGGNLPLPRIGR